jgi:hypothetical protein
MQNVETVLGVLRERGRVDFRWIDCIDNLDNRTPKITQ